MINESKQLRRCKVEACHCEELSRSDLLIRQRESNSGEGATKRLPRHSVKKQTAFTNTVPRNDKHVCHPEFISGSSNHEILNHLTASPTDTGSHKIFKILNEILKQVQDDIYQCQLNDKNFGSLCKVQDDKKPCHCEEQTKSATSQSQNLQNSTIMRLLRFARNDKKYNSKQLTVNSEQFNYNKKNASRFSIDVSRFKAAFTLAEVLITLAIIGIVAAMTLPSLIAKHQEKETVTKLKKVYSTLSQAYQLTQNEYGTPDNWTEGKSISQRRDALMSKFIKNMKVLKICEIGTGCFPDVTYMLPNGEEYYNINANADVWKFQLADGTLIAYNYMSHNCSDNYGEGKHLSSVCGIFDVDINGANKPNLLGRDVFSFYLTKYGIIPDGSAEEVGTEYSSLFSDCSTLGYGCTSWVIFNENMDYLKCPEKLGWDKDSSCK